MPEKGGMLGELGGLRGDLAKGVGVFEGLDTPMHTIVTDLVP